MGPDQLVFFWLISAAFRLRADIRNQVFKQ